MSTAKKALRGLSNLGIFPVMKNDMTGYSVGTKIPVYGVQEITSQKDINEWKVYADDGLYDSGAEWKGSSFSLTLAGLPNELRSYFEGGVYDEATGEYTYSSVSEAPEIALSFSSVSDSESLELTKVYSAKCTKISFEHKTRGDGNSVTPVRIEGNFMQRKIDGAIFTKKEAATSDISWLDTIEAVS
ncbi:MAG: hypothetical protein BWY15_01089 [Firmicutes bacterium ADurb.Bin193]|nr:MAG: hypothetical protein BWY15_01089 [Firmicutes bacterium ADurb.Bin193]